MVRQHTCTGTSGTVSQYNKHFALQILNARTTGWLGSVRFAAGFIKRQLSTVWKLSRWQLENYTWYRDKYLCREWKMPHRAEFYCSSDPCCDYNLGILWFITLLDTSKIGVLVDYFWLHGPMTIDRKMRHCSCLCVLIDRFVLSERTWCILK